MRCLLLVAANDGTPINGKSRKLPFGVVAHYVLFFPQDKALGFPIGWYFYCYVGSYSMYHSVRISPVGIMGSSSSTGRAPARHAGGWGFESLRFHIFSVISCFLMYIFCLEEVNEHSLVVQWKNTPLRRGRSRVRVLPREQSILIKE